MHIVENRFRLLCLGTIFGAIFLLFPFIGQNRSEASSPTVEKMAVAELNRIINSDSGSALVFFTAAWCGHCKAMIPTLNRLYHRFNDKGLRFIGISIDAGGPAAMQQALEEKPVDFAVFWVGETALDAFRLLGIPMIFLVKRGQLVEKIPGKCSYTLLEGKIMDVIK